MRALPVLAVAAAAACAVVLVWAQRSGPAPIGSAVDATRPRAADAASAAPELANPAADPTVPSTGGAARATSPREPAAVRAGGRWIRGRVVLHDGVTPAAQVWVLAEAAPAADAEGDARPGGDDRAPAPSRTTSRYSSGASTDEDGAFLIEAVPAERVVVHAHHGVLLAHATDPLDVGAGLADVLVVLPESSTLTGRVLLPDGVRAEDLRVQVRRARVEPRPLAETDAPAREPDPEPILAARLDAAGTFRTGQVAAGRYAVALTMEPPSFGRRGGLDRLDVAIVPLGEVALAPGDVEHTFDARALFPGTLLVTVLSRRDVRTSLTLVLTGRSGRAGERREEAVPWDTAFEVGPLAPGAWNIALEGQPGWRWTHPSEAGVLPGRATEVTVLLELLDGTLEVRAPDGGAVASDVLLARWHEPLGGGFGNLTIDEAGRVRLRAPAGSFTASLLPPPEVSFDPTQDFSVEVASSTSVALPVLPSVDVAWTAAGPEPAVLWFPERR